MKQCPLALESERSDLCVQAFLFACIHMHMCVYVHDVYVCEMCVGTHTVVYMEHVRQLCGIFLLYLLGFLN